MNIMQDVNSTCTSYLVWCVRGCDIVDRSGRAVPILQKETQEQRPRTLMCVQEKPDGIKKGLLATAADMRKAVEFASACGALTTLKPGAIAAQPRLDAIQELAKQRGE
jgi:hypothetical protein